MNRIVVAALLIVSQVALFAKEYQISSPNKRVKVEVVAEQGTLTYQVSKGDEVLIPKSQIGLEANLFSSADWGAPIDVEETSGTDNHKLYWGTTSQLDEAFKQITLTFNDGVDVEFRAYDRGVAWRYVTDFEDALIVENEIAEFNLAQGSTVYFPEADGFSTPFEANYLPHKVGSLEESMFGITPLMVKTSQGTAMVISEVNLFNYPGMFIDFDKNGLKTSFPKYPEVEKEQFLGRLRLTNIPQLSKKMVKKERDYIAKCKGAHTFPWRVVLIEDEEINLLSNNLVAALADQPDEDFSWVKPGKVVWDWYHKWNLQGVGFKPGINTATYKYMIDFAAENNLQYVNIDDGWCGLHNFRKINKNLNVKEVIEYAEGKEIGIFLWCTWQTLAEDLEGNLDYFKELGAAGLKVDFFDRADQVVVDFVNELARESAERELLLNLHGMFKPTGIQVTFPNVVNLEGILGLEYNKFSDKCTPSHNATVAYTRNVVGPMDYTPGGMRYVDSADFEKSWANPHVMTTKAQQMAMYVVYHGGVQMLADSPTLYEKDTIALNFLSNVPVTWDETVPIEGGIGESVVVARRNGEDWYLAGIIAGEEKEFNLNVDFLHEGTYSVNLLSDGETASELKSTQYTLGDKMIKVKARSAGGFVLQIIKK